MEIRCYIHILVKMLLLLVKKWRMDLDWRAEVTDKVEAHGRISQDPPGSGGRLVAKQWGDKNTAESREA
jgi:hypothetical protein